MKSIKACSFISFCLLLLFLSCFDSDENKNNKLTVNVTYPSDAVGQKFYVYAYNEDQFAGEPAVKTDGYLLNDSLSATVELESAEFADTIYLEYFTDGPDDDFWYSGGHDEYLEFYMDKALEEMQGSFSDQSITGGDPVIFTDHKTEVDVELNPYITCKGCIE